MSLRARLVVTLVALSAAGLLVLGAITYLSQRSYQLDLLDQRTVAAGPATGRALDERGYFFPGGPHRTGDFGMRDGVGAGGGRGGPPDAADNLPEGTFGQRRTLDGKVIGSVVLTSGESFSPPALPAVLEPGRPFTVRSRDGGFSYRVRVTATREGRGLAIVAVPMTGVDETLDRLLLVEGLVIAGVLIALGVAAMVLVRVGLRPLEGIATTADAIAGGDLSRRASVEDERTEVGRLGLAFNQMLGRLEGAFARREESERRLRQFLSDASHELRTPLASIRGYAELYRIGAARSPADTEKAMRRIEDESARMGVLVEDLLTLARLDEVRVASEEPVDLAQLAEDAVADARAMDPSRSVEAVLDGEPIVMGEPDRLRQVLANLVRNAIVHTPEGTRVVVGARVEGDAAVLEVRDFGPGLPGGSADHAELFERFWRAEAGRERGKGGAGLGLAIVAGIVSAHRGTVEASNAPDGGARFVVRLPLAG